MSAPGTSTRSAFSQKEKGRIKCFFGSDDYICLKRSFPWEVAFVLCGCFLRQSGKCAYLIFPLILNKNKMNQSKETAQAVNPTKALSVMLLGLASTLVLSSIVVVCVMKWLTQS
jgi:hypothetical protein